MYVGSLKGRSSYLTHLVVHPKLNILHTTFNIFATKSVGWIPEGKKFISFSVAPKIEHFAPKIGHFAPKSVC